MELKMVDLNQLKTGGLDIRSESGGASFDELKESVKSKGVIFPLVATKNGADYVVLDGHRRLKACRALGADSSKKLPILVVEADAGTAVESALIANAVREDIDSTGLAEAVNLPVSKYGRGVKDVAGILGKSEVYIRRLLKIFTLPPAMLKALRQNKLSLAHAHWLSRVAGRTEILNESFDRAVKERLSSRDLETLISSLKQGSVNQGGAPAYFGPKVVTTKAGSRLRFEARRRSIRVELNLSPDESVDHILAQLGDHLRKLQPKRLKAVG